jgi:hypothetical protein
VKTYGDIARFRFEDTYRNLTLKTSAGLHWIRTFCSSARYVLKTDDDVLLFPKRVVMFLEKLDPDNEQVLYSGETMTRGPPRRDKKSQFYVPYDWYPYVNHPYYNIGVGVLMSQGVVRWFAENSRRVPRVASEDMLLGILAKSIGIKPTCNRGIGYGFVPYQGNGTMENYCFYFDVMVMGVDQTYEHLLWPIWDIYDNVTSNNFNVTCTLESRARRNGNCWRYPKDGVKVVGLRPDIK